MIVSNASPIIYFGKQGKLDILKKCFKEVLIPKEVYDEIICKKESHEVIALEKAINENWIKIKKTKILNILNTKNLGKGEKEAISLAYKNKTILLLDDDSAKAYASILNIESRGSLYILFISCKKHIIKKEEAKNIFENMIRDGFYVSTDLYAEFFRLLEDV